MENEASHQKLKSTLREAAINSSLDHPNIVSTYTYNIQPLNVGSNVSQHNKWNVFFNHLVAHFLYHCFQTELSNTIISALLWGGCIGLANVPDPRVLQRWKPIWRHLLRGLSPTRRWQSWAGCGVWGDPVDGHQHCCGMLVHPQEPDHTWGSQTWQRKWL